MWVQEHVRERLVAVFEDDGAVLELGGWSLSVACYWISRE